MLRPVHLQARSAAAGAAVIACLCGSLQPARADEPSVPAARGLWSPAVWLEPTVPPGAAPAERTDGFFQSLVAVAGNLGARGRYDEAAARLEGLLLLADAHGAPRFLAAEAAFSLGVARLRAGDGAGGADALARAVALGYGDPIAFQELLPAAAWSDERVRAVYARIELTDIDLEELWWARREAMSINHDTTACITANIGRKDRDWTQLATVAIPTRATTNTAVEMHRHTLRYLQGEQRSYVMASDQSRMSHLMSQDVIERMGPPVDEYRKQEEVLRSREEAARRYRSMVADVASRRFAPKPGTTGARIAPPPPGSLTPSAAPAAAPSRLAFAPAAALDARPGDWGRFETTIEVEGTEPVRTTSHEWVTAVRGGLASSVTVRRGGDGSVSAVEDGAVLYLASARDGLLLQLSALGAVEAEGYRAQPVTRNFRGKSVAAEERVLDARFLANDGSEPIPCEVRVVVSKEVGGEVYPLEIDLSRAGFRLRARLVDCGRAPR